MEFLRCDKETTTAGTRLFPKEASPYQPAEPVLAIGAEVESAYRAAFAAMPLVRFALIVEPRNGASGYWTISPSPTEGPLFVVEVDPAIAADESRFNTTMAHELAHPILRLLRVPNTFAVSPNPQGVGDELDSTTHHPFVFWRVAAAGYDDLQRAEYAASATAELKVLQAADLTGSNYTAPPGQIWRALWYFNFSLLAAEQYREIRNLCERRVPPIFQRMCLLENCWREARQAGNADRFVARTIAFRTCAWRSLELEGYMRSREFPEWAKWMFPWQ